MSQRDRLLGRRRPSRPYRLLVDQDEVGPARDALARVQLDAQAAGEAVRRAEAGVRQAQGGAGRGRAAAIRSAQDALEAAKARQLVADRAVADAEADVEACYETIVLRALEPSALEDLIAAYPPTEAQMDATRKAREQAVQRGEQPEPWPSYDDDRFYPALLAASAEDAGMSADDWAAFFKSNVSNAEKVGLRRLVLELNHRERIADPLVLPKGLTQIINSLSRST